MQIEQLSMGLIRDKHLQMYLQHGIGIHHAGLHEQDRSRVEELFLNRKIQALPLPSLLPTVGLGLRRGLGSRCWWRRQRWPGASTSPPTSSS